MGLYYSAKNMDRIYKTDYFKERLEIHAKENLQRELEQLKG